MHGKDTARVNGLDLGVARKVSLIERQYTHHSMHSHCRDQARIVHLDTRYIMGNDQSAPFLMNQQGIGK
jgi:hypothetical protein